MRAATEYIPKVGGQITTLSSPARQNPRTSRSIASSLPRPTRPDSGLTSYSDARRSTSARGCGSGYRLSPASEPSEEDRHGSSLACSRSSAGSQTACSYALSATISGRASSVTQLIGLLPTPVRPAAALLHSRGRRGPRAWPVRQPPVPALATLRETAPAPSCLSRNQALT